MDNNSFTINSPRPNLPIITHLIDAYKLWHDFIPHIPKDSRYTLGLKIDNLLTEISESVFIASYVGKDQKPPYIQKAAARLDLLKFFMQILWEIGALDTKKYIMLSEKLDEIGRMLGGWLRQAANRNPSAGHH
jgi:hypothetical protein